MNDPGALRKQLKTIMVENLMLQVAADEIRDDQPLFGPGSLGLDSVDALQVSRPNPLARNESAAN